MDRRTLLKLLPTTGFVSWATAFPVAAGDHCLTTPDIEGPYYKPNAPFEIDLAGDEPGERLVISGTVFASDCQTPVPQAVIDVWHANAQGAYDEVKFRAKILTDHNGHYEYLTVLPGKYLNGASFRPRHLHYMVHYKQAPVLTTQLYFKGDSSIPTDPWASDPDANERIIDLQLDRQQRYHGVVDITLNVSPDVLAIDVAEGMPNLRMFPVPASGDRLTLAFAVPPIGKIVITDLNGRIYATSPIEDQDMLTYHIQLVDSNGIRWPKGVYLVYARVADAKEFRKRFVVV